MTAPAPTACETCEGEGYLDAEFSSHPGVVWAFPCPTCSCPVCGGPPDHDCEAVRD